MESGTFLITARRLELLSLLEKLRPLPIREITGMYWVCDECHVVGSEEEFEHDKECAHTAFETLSKHISGSTYPEGREAEL